MDEDFRREPARRWDGRPSGTEADRELAGLLGIDPVTLLRALGGGWRRETQLVEPTGERWYVGGEPPQIAVALEGDQVLLGRPDPHWELTLHWRFDVRHRFRTTDLRRDPDAVREAADGIARRRRQTFRWCPWCRQLNAPETFLRDEGVCMGCAPVHLGIVF